MGGESETQQWELLAGLQSPEALGALLHGGCGPAQCHRRIDPFERGELDSFQRAPGPAPADDLSLEQAVDGFGVSARALS